MNALFDKEVINPQEPELIPIKLLEIKVRMDSCTNNCERHKKCHKYTVQKTILTNLKLLANIVASVTTRNSARSPPLWCRDGVTASHAAVLSSVPEG